MPSLCNGWGPTLWLGVFGLLMGSGSAIAHGDHGDQGHAGASTGFSMQPQRDEATVSTVSEAEGDEESESDDKWDVATADLGPTQVLKFTTEEATWMAVDVSPDGQWLVFDTLGDVYRVPMSGGTAEIIRGGRAYEHQPRFSPDGQWISFTSDAGGGDNLWVSRVDGSDARAVTTEDFRLLNNGVWHPNGRYLVGRKHFTSRRSAGAGELWLYDVASGGGGVQLVEKPTDQKDLGEPSFSPDGRYIYYSLDSTGGKTFEYNKNPHGTIYTIRRLDLQTGETITVAGGQGGSARPEVSPDGRHLAFVKRTRMKTSLMLLDLETGLARAVFDGLDRDQQEAWAIFGVYPGFSFTPDGEAVVIWAGGRLNRVDLASGQSEAIAIEIPVEQELVETLRFAPEIAGETFDVKAIRWPRVSPDGQKVVFTALGHLYIRDVEGGVAKRLTSGEAFEFYPRWSPDGRRIVFVTWQDLVGGHVQSVAANGKRGQTHTLRPGHYTNPSYSPDGSQVLYYRGRSDGYRGLGHATEQGSYTVAAKKKAKPRLVTTDGSSPTWSPDGERIHLFEWTQDEKRLYSVDLMGGNRRNLVTSERAMELTLSPDGQWVAFTELWDVYVAPRPLAGGAVAVGPKMGNLPVVKVSDVSGGGLDWSADSTRLRFSLGPELTEVEVAPLFEHSDDPPEVERSVTHLGWSAETDIPPTDLAFVGATILTMEDDVVIEDGVVRVQGDRIVAVGARGEVDTTGARIVDVAGKVLMPGFVDVHAHVGSSNQDLHSQQVWGYLANLAFGVTTMHDPSNHTSRIFASSELVRAGLVTGPRVFSTGTVLYGAEGEFKALTNSLDDAVRHLKRQKAWGAWSVKSYNQPRREQRQQIIRAGRDLEMMVVPEGGSTFVHNMSEVLDGHTTIEHNLPIAPLYEDVLRVFSESGTGYTPTLNVAYGGLSGELYWYQASDVWSHEKLARFVPRRVIDPSALRGTRANESDFHHVEIARSAAELHRRGGIVELGSHGQMQGLGTHWEIWSFAQGGLEPLEVLEVATLGGARALGLDGQLGTVTKGKLADLIVMDEDPLEDIQNTDSISMVMIGGRLFDANTLDQLAPEALPLPPGPALNAEGPR